MGRISRLYNKAYDFKTWIGEPTITYMVATTPRAGSTLFCTSLWQTAALGAPMEYLNEGNEWFIKGLADRSIIEYWEDLRARRTSLNGIFGFKMFTMMYTELKKHDQDILPFINPQFVIHLVRRDRVAQAVSYHKAISSQSWFGDVRGRSQAFYDFDEIEKCEMRINRQEEDWENIFRRTNCRPLKVYYEDFLRSPNEIIRAIGSFMDVDLDFAGSSTNVCSLNVETPIVQRNAESYLWCARYKIEKRNKFAIS